jgi:hypothetical protein
MIQYPAVKTICPTFISKQGAGKSQIVYTMMAGMLGTSKVFETTDPSRDVWGQFNGRMANSFLIILNEMSLADTKESEGRMKGLVTDASLITINKKSVNQSVCHFQLPPFYCYNKQ